MTKPTTQDEICYCARCGISFIWTQEEQQATPEPDSAHSPALCPGCRRLVPPAGRERGLVKWYDRRKQYGFIIRQHEPDIYVHRSGLRGSGALRPGDLVEFSVETSERGPAAAEVRVLTAASAPEPR